MTVHRKHSGLHGLPHWVETRKDALEEAYYLYNWYKNCEKEAFLVLVQLCRTIDEAQEELFVDEQYIKRLDDSRRKRWSEDSGGSP